MHSKKSISLRRLEIKDAVYMLEWMHDTNVNSWFIKNFSELTINDCIRFIESSWHDKNNVHLAVVDINDNYMGTVSLKNIDRKNGMAELAITMRSVAMGTGLAQSAIHEIISIGKSDLGLDIIYWNVLKNNKRAIRFYEKNGFKRANKAMMDKILLGGGATRATRFAFLVLYCQDLIVCLRLFSIMRERRRIDAGFDYLFKRI